MDLEASFMAKPSDESLLCVRASRSDISSAKLKMYHELCNRRLENTLHLFRVREERERLYVARGTKKQRVGADLCPSPSFESRDRQWKLIRESNDIRVYRHIRRSYRTSAMMASGTIHGSLGDVMNGLYADTAKDAQVLHTLLSNKFLDADVLHVDRRGDDHEPFQFSGITWTALKTPGLFFCKNRDLLCFKKMDCFKDDFGDEFGYLVLQSIDPTDECVKSIRSKATRYVRGYISVAILFKKQANDLVSMYMHGEFNPKGRISSAFGDASFASSIVALANTAQSGQAKNLSMLLHSFSAPGLPPLMFGAKAGAKDVCGVCARSLYFWDAPQHCRGCWQRTCRACRIKKPIFCAQLHRSHQGKKSQAPCTETFCLQCVASVIPSGVQTKAKLLKQLEKKRKRSGASLHQRHTLSSSRATDAVAYQASAAQSAPYVASAAASSSMPSLFSFPSTDAGAASDLGAPRAVSAAAAMPDFRLGSRQYHRDVLAAGLTREPDPARNGGGATTTAIPSMNMRAARPPRTDEYYQKVLQRYLRSNRSYISMNSNLSSALTNGSSRHALTDREEDACTVRSVPDSVSTGSAASLATADHFFKHL
ncbi:hypothetical protein PybrP1_010100 [[Pythium] brassicae (nom. inval.)]|nr:hypothetical protein PybrP1_010100 [[Pythium] brassicae (nom. inval.)]